MLLKREKCCGVSNEVIENYRGAKIKNQMWECPVCDHLDTTSIFIISEKNQNIDELMVNYCPLCGKKISNLI